MRLLGKQLISLFCHHCQAKSLCSSATLFCHLSIPTPFQLLTTGNHLLNTVGLEKGIWKTQQWPQDWKRSVFIPIPKKGNAKECSNYSKIAFILHTSKVMLKILQGRLQQYVNRELLDAQAGFRKGRGTRDQIANTCWIIGNAREFQKNIYFCFIFYAKAFDYVDHNKLWKILKDGNTRAPYLPPEKLECKSRSNS